MIKSFKVKNIEKKGKKYLIILIEENNLKEEEFIITEDQIVNLRLIKDKILDNNEYKKLKQEVKLETYYLKAINYINFKIRTEKEVRTYLEKEDLTKENINKIIKKLKNISFIDDERYTDLYIDESIRKRKGKYLIRYSLIQKGIDINQIEEKLVKYDYDTEVENASFLANKLSTKYDEYPIRKQQQKITEKLISEGYETNIIRVVLANIELTDNSYEKLVNEYQKYLNKELPKEKIISKLLQHGYEYSKIKQVIGEYE